MDDANKLNPFPMYHVTLQELAWLRHHITAYQTAKALRRASAACRPRGRLLASRHDHWFEPALA